MRPSSRLCLSGTQPRTIAGPINSVLPPTIRARLAESTSGHSGPISIDKASEQATRSPTSSSSSTTPGPGPGAQGGGGGKSQIQIDGWLKSVRGHKNVVFAEVGDGSSGEGLQAVFKGKARVEGLDAGASVRMYGELVESKGKGQARELLVDNVKIIGACDPEDYPIQKKHLPEPVLRELAHLRFRTTQTSAIMRIRDGSMRDWHDWFEENEFIHIHTPILTSSDCEGAGETFGVVAPGDPVRVPSSPAPSTSSSSSPASAAASTLISTSPSATVSASLPEPFFPTPVNLTVSSQLHLEAPTHSLSRTYTLSPSFRAEPSLTSRHLSEFYMLEGEVVLSSLEELMSVVEDGIRSVLSRMLDGSERKKRWGGMKSDLERIHVHRQEVGQEGSDAPGEGLDHLVSTARNPFHRITYTAAISELSARHAEHTFDQVPDWDNGLPSQQEKYLAGKYGPTFITHYPAHLKPFYMLPSSADPSTPASASAPESESSSSSPSPSKRDTVACFDLLFPGIGELAGGSMREHRLPHLIKALETHGLDKEKYGWYLDLRRYGSVPHGGWGMGWDRWISWLTGVGNLRDVVAFPRWKGNCRY